MWRSRGASTLACAAVGTLLAAAAPPRDATAQTETPPEEILLEFHFLPVPNLQIAIWLEDAEGNFVRDVFVTQKTGKLGIGNRSGRWDFLSSWRFPYGPRPMVMPVWAHRRGKTYPKVIFHDTDERDLNSMGWHENTSSPETFYCRPLTQGENAIISVDTMTCPSPSTFQSDKGMFHPSERSVYPPRNDLTAFEDGADHPDTFTYAEINDLDAVTRATPPGDTAALVTARIERELAEAGPLRAFIEVSLENDQNDSYTFAREDHYIDERLPSYGVPWMGQPSVVYSVEFDPAEAGFTSTLQYAGYGEWDGTNGTLYPPDATISTSGRSGADRLMLQDLGAGPFRFGVYSPGTAVDPGTPPGPGPGGGGVGGTCRVQVVPLPTDVTFEAVDFDEVEVSFVVPTVPAGMDLDRAQLYYLIGSEPMSEATLDAAIQREFPLDAAAGERVSLTLDQLWGNYTYQVGVRLQDRCDNRSALTTDEVSTPRQEFATVDGLCFVATAAYGANWTAEVQALRWARDAYLRANPLTHGLVQVYYAWSPGFARIIEANPVARAGVRVLLKPLANLARASTSGN
jgi:hypothetical protein